MADNQHYVIDDGQNKIPGYTKTEVDELIESGAKAWSGTQAEYNALKQAGLLQPRSLYIITDAANLNGTAADLSFDGTPKTTKQAIEGLIKYVVGYADIVSTQIYSDYRYADITFQNIDRTKVIGVVVIGTPTNRPAFAILMDGTVTKVRVFANGYSDGSSIPVRLAYIDY